MSTAALSAIDIPVMGIAAELAMGLYYYPGVKVGKIEPLGPKPFPDRIRKSLVEKAGGKCRYCGVTLSKEDTHIDHRWPRSKGGRHWLVNLQAICATCNLKKSDKIDSVILEVLKDALPVIVASGRTSIPFGRISRIQLRNLLSAARIKNQIGALLPFILISPNTAILIVGGVVLVVAGFFAVKWLLRHADGERRYVRMARTMRDSLSTLAHHTGRLTRHLESAARARQAQAQIARSARIAGNAAGAVAGQVGRASDHVPRLAGNAGRAATDRVRELPGRMPSVSVPLDPMSRHAADVSRRAGEVSRQAGHVPARVSRQARNVVAGATPVRERAQDTLGRMAGRVPRFRRRQQQETGMAEAG